MSYVALATDNFDRMTRFYGQTLAFPVLDEWDRSRGRGRRFDLGKGLKLELLDNQREAKPLLISCLGDRLHIVVEVIDIYRARAGLSIQSPDVQRVSWGALLFQIKDPDGTPITYLEWTDKYPPESVKRLINPEDFHRSKL
jgi:catechol 2,3-dioxygenase-like lactoylglutathione lyase family enzyme